MNSPRWSSLFRDVLFAFFWALVLLALCLAPNVVSDGISFIYADF